MSTTTTTTSTTCDPLLSLSSLQDIVISVQTYLARPEVRCLSQRAVQARVWHQVPMVAQRLMALRRVESELERTQCWPVVSQLVYRFHQRADHVTLIRAGIVVKEPTNDNTDNNDDDTDNTDSDAWLALDCKERLYLLLKQYDWLKEFARSYPIHFYENSIAFVDQIRVHRRNGSSNKKEENNDTNDTTSTTTRKHSKQTTQQQQLPVVIKIIGLGIGGAMAASGCAKHGCESVVAYEQRRYDGGQQHRTVRDLDHMTTSTTTTTTTTSNRQKSSVTSRYQNASWRAYHTAAQLVDDTAYQELIQYRQRVVVNSATAGAAPAATTVTTTTDRVQIILGHAIECAIESARRYGVNLQFEVTDTRAYYYDDDNDNDDDKNNKETKKEEKEEDRVVERQARQRPAKADLVALFCGVHTSRLVPGLADAMQIVAWPHLTSHCLMWLQLSPSPLSSMPSFLAGEHDDNHDPITDGGGGGGACIRGGEIGAETWHYTIQSSRDNRNDVWRIWDHLQAQQQSQQPLPADGDDDYQEKQARIRNVLQALEDGTCSRFTYTFTNLPRNDYNQRKRNAAENVVLDGEYSVPVQMATQPILFRQRQGPVSLSTTTNENANQNQSHQQSENQKKDDHDADQETTNDHQQQQQGELVERLLRNFNTDAIVLGGDACVPPNPLAAYGATLACDAASNLVQLAVAIGHLNALVINVQHMKEPHRINSSSHPEDDVMDQIQHLKTLLYQYYQAKSRSENYFQFIQTLICNLYSLEPMANTTTAEEEEVAKS